MTARLTPARSLVVVGQSLRGRCDVCQTAGVMRLVSTLGIPAAPGVGTGCPHCNPAAFGLTTAVEVWPLPMLDDIARTA